MEKNYDNYQNLSQNPKQQAKEAINLKISEKARNVKNAQNAVDRSNSKYFGGVIETVNNMTQGGINTKINE
jgi:hypothetical protein